ncbi:isochorismatase family protein [Pseudoalteromonas sp. SMS1]|uniref:isochorismatase family protein n=1 Tax=Pseudoalteromonas sp. SMS1 TaxID=2908894 RepID=UPI001F38D6DA|nr:isochorismatase family protein [Pseudoalteromonas sp. SMS1]MCF2856039.1 isochorismatase family protein [Pseudoalteromonas sp. SMS1]
MTTNVHLYEILVVDIQQNFEPHITEYDATVKITQKLLSAAQTLDIPTIAFEQYPKGLGHTDSRLLAYSPPVVEKTTFSATPQNSDFANKIDHQSIKVLVGLEAHICVYHTATDLLNQGHRVYIIADGVCSRNPQHKAWALEQLRNDGAKVMSLETFLFEVLKDAKHAKFKQISKLIQ